jgi:hypothetical protein
LLRCDATAKTTSLLLLPTSYPNIRLTELEAIKMPLCEPLLLFPLRKLITSGRRPFIVVSRLSSPLVASLRTTRAYTSHSGTPHVKFTRVNTKFVARARLVSKADWPRTVYVEKLPPFAIAEDVQNLFEESGYPV